MTEKSDLLEEMVYQWTFEEEGPENLQEYLGMTDDQYAVWEKSSEVPEGWEPPE